MTSRKIPSMSLSQAIRNEILHKFFCDIRRDAMEKLRECEEEAALAIYDLIYGQHSPTFAMLPDAMFEMSDQLPLVAVCRRKAKKARKKGEIEPSSREWFSWRNFAHSIDIRSSDCSGSCDRIMLPEPMAQVNPHFAGRWADGHMKGLIRGKFVTKAQAARIEVRYIQACKTGAKIIAPVADVVEDVIEIMSGVKTTKGLFAAWPEAEQYLKLPEAPAGALMKVDIVSLNDRLTNLYPPAEKNSGA